MRTTFDLSSITDRLLKLLDDAARDWPEWTSNGGHVPKFTIVPSPLMPEAARNLGDCVLSFYLFHLQPDVTLRNWPPVGRVAQPNATQPLGLELSYLLTAYSNGNAVQEQQAMSIAIRALHEHATYNDPADDFSFTITLEAEKSDEANRRWQSFSAPYRLSVAYRIGVVLLAAARPAPPAQPAPHSIGLAVAPGTLPFASAGALVATASQIELTPRNPLPTDTIHHDYSPAVARPSERLLAFGSGLDQRTASRLYLLDGAGVETEISAWKAAPAEQTDSRLVATLPATVGAVPANAPLPGLYQLRVGSSRASGDAADYRSNAAPVSIAAQTAAVPAPWRGPPFVIAGAGFIAGATELYLDTTALTEAAGGAAADGEFAINGAGTSISFRPPTGFAAGAHAVRLRVRGVEGPLVGEVVLP